MPFLGKSTPAPAAPAAPAAGTSSDDEDDHDHKASRQLWRPALSLTFSFLFIVCVY